MRGSEGYHGIGMQHGRLLEHDLLGEVKIPNELSDAEKRYMKYNEAVSWVKNHQPGESTNPRAPFANELRIELLDLLGLERPEQFNKVHFYTAVGSHLDYFHGVDAFFEFDADNNLPKGRVSLGVTLRDKSGDSLKTDIEIWAPADGIDETDKKFTSQVRKVAQAIVARLKGAAPEIVDLHTKH